MARTDHVTASTTAQTVTLTAATGAGAVPIKRVAVINVNGTSAQAVYFTINADGSTPTTAVAEADDTYVSLLNIPAVVDVHSATEVKVSIIAASGTPKVAIIGA